jgi:hypothetical protein
MHVVILKKALLFASLATRAHERALLSVAFVYGATHIGRDMPRILRAALRSGLRGRGMPTPLGVLNGELQRTLEQLGDVSRRDRVRQ